MPIRQGYTTRNGERVGYYQWGDSGTKYTYEIGNDSARRAAKSRARQQQQAARSSGYER